MAAYKTPYSWSQADKDGLQELNRLIARFPNAQTFTVTWEWRWPNYWREEGITWDKAKRTYEGICIGEPCPIENTWHGISQQDIEKAASKNQTMIDIVTEKHLN